MTLRTLLLKWCQKRGHWWKAKRVVIRKEARIYFVAEDYYAVIEYCNRCGKIKSLFEGEYITGYTSVSMPAPMWRFLRENGYVIVEEA